MPKTKSTGEPSSEVSAEGSVCVVERRRGQRRASAAATKRTTKTKRPSAKAKKPAKKDSVNPDVAEAKEEAVSVRPSKPKGNDGHVDRRQKDRRGKIDPTTCERDYQPDEVEFMNAMDDYKRRSGRPFPTWSEVLEVLRDLGYRKVAPPTQTYVGAT